MHAKSLLAIALAASLAACSKSEPSPAPKAQASAPKPAAAPTTPAKSAEIDDGLKERLARQEAAARMFESKVLQPPPPRAPEPPPPAVKAATPQPAPAPAPALPARVEAPKSEPPKPEPPKVAARTEPPQAASPAPAAPPPRTDLAAARPSAPPDSATTRLVTKIDPDFPREAVVAGVDQGSVKARMTLDSSGNVARVEVLDANPRRVFDRAVVRALSQWRYNDGAAGRTVDLEVAFRR